MSYPITPLVPQQTTYNYVLNPPGNEDQQTINHMKAAIGSKINSRYEDGRNLTPIQKQRIAIISAAAVAVIAAVALIILASTCPPLLIPGLALMGLGIGLAYYGMTRKDINSPKERTEMIQNIAHLSFSEIARSHQWDDIVGYALLDGIAPKSSTNPDKRAELYVRYQKLLPEISRLQSWKHTQETNAESHWAQNTQSLRNWHSSVTSSLHYNIDNIKFRLHHDRATIRHVERRTHRPQIAMRVFNALGHQYDRMNLAELRNELDQANATFAHQIAPWNTWKAVEFDTIAQLNQRMINKIEEQFTILKANVAA